MKTTILAISALALVSQVAHADPTGAEKYPTLAKLCDATKAMNQSKLSLAAVVVSPSEVWEVSFNCDYDFSSPAHAFSGGHLTATHTIVAGSSENEDQIAGFGRIETPLVGTKHELNLVFVSDHEKIAVADDLRLNAEGQPLNSKDHFSGTVITSKSGTYVEEDAIEAKKTCEESAEDATDVSTCDQITAGTSASFLIGDQNFNPITNSLGWVMNLYPTNTNLDQAAGRVDFQAALKELALVINDGNVTEAVFQSTIKSATDSLKKTAAN